MIQQTILFCPQCCNQNDVSSTFCGSCGLKLPTSQTEYINSITKSAKQLITTKYELHTDISKLNSIYQQLKAEKEQIEEDLASIKPMFDEQLQELDKLQIETAIHDFGFYSSRYNFESSDAY